MYDDRDEPGTETLGSISSGSSASTASTYEVNDVIGGAAAEPSSMRSQM